MSFAHLHLHTEYSLLDGAARISDVVGAASRMGQPAIGITDHGNLYGVVDFVKAAKEHGIKPIIGIEAYFTDGSRFDRPPSDQNKRYHTLLFAESEVGYRNLLQLSSKSYLEGYYYKPRMDFELLAEHSEGIMATSGCLGGLVPQLLGPDAMSIPIIGHGIFWFAVKTGLFMFLYLWLRATFPRYRYDQIMRLGWKVFIPVTIVWIVVVGLAIQLGVPPWFSAA